MLSLLQRYNAVDHPARLQLTFPPRVVVPLQHSKETPAHMCITSAVLTERQRFRMLELLKSHGASLEAVNKVSERAGTPVTGTGCGIPGPRDLKAVYLCVNLQVVVHC